MIILSSFRKQYNIFKYFKKTGDNKIQLILLYEKIFKFYERKIKKYAKIKILNKIFSN